MEAAVGTRPPLQRSASELTLPDGRPAWRALLDPVRPSPAPSPRRASLPSLQRPAKPEPQLEPRLQLQPETPWKTLETVLASLREDRVVVKCATPTGTTATPTGTTAVTTSSGSSGRGKAYYLNRLRKAMQADHADSPTQPAVKVVRLESFQGSELPGAVQPFSPEEKVASWIRTASIDVEQNVIEPVAASEPDQDLIDAAQLQEATERIEGHAHMKTPKEQAVLAHVLRRLESLETSLNEERQSKHDLVSKYERLLQERSDSHRRDVSALEQMLHSMQSENQKLTRQLEHLRKARSFTAPLASTSPVCQ